MEVLALLEADDWRSSVHHVFREANFCGDALADLGHQGGFLWSVLDTIPVQLGLVLAADDVRGLTSFRLTR